MKDFIVTQLEELIDQAIMLKDAKSSRDIAEFLAASSVVRFPAALYGDAYFLSCRGMFGSLLTTGCVVKRKIDKIAFDGKIEIISYRPNPNDKDGNLYGYLNENVFLSEEEATNALEKIWKNARMEDRIEEVNT